MKSSTRSRFWLCRFTGWTLALALMLGGTAQAQTPDDDLDLDNLGSATIQTAAVQETVAPDQTPAFTRGFLTPRTDWDASTGQFLVDHRPRQKFTKNPFKDGLGFDSGALKIGLEFRYAPWSFLESWVRRQNGSMEVYDTYEWGVRGKPLTQDFAGVDVVVGAGISWFSQPNTSDAVGFHGQLLVSRSLPGGVVLNAGVLGASQSSGFNKSDLDPSQTIALAGSLDWRPPWFDFLRITGEFDIPISGYDAGNPAWAMGLSFLSWRHVFSVLLTNTQMLTIDSVAPGSDRAMDDLLLGFTIGRQFDF